MPDEGIWEIRSSRVHHTHSKVMAWVGLDRLIRICSKYRWNTAPVTKFKNVSSLIAQEIESRGFNNFLNHYTRDFDGNDLDAALLVLPLVNYCKASSPRMKSTIKSIQTALSRRSFILRHRMDNDGLAGNEGAFIVCNFWLVENHVQTGALDEAINLFNKTVQHATPTALLSEEIDPDTNELLGNYPQGFSHIGLINAALAIDAAIIHQRGRGQ
jgi:GH15 family glucan-1,4-alpha-glucosidase